MPTSLACLFVCSFVCLFFVNQVFGTHYRVTHWQYSSPSFYDCSTAHACCNFRAHHARWSECVDEHIFEAIVWLRTAAAAEKMWSPEAATKTASAAVASRLALHRCRMLGRNITVEPLNDSGEYPPRSVNPLC